jgi:multifunctional 2-oxoglutarate metabolism enzyme
MVYSTDAAKAIQAPVFHVNGDDPEAVARVAQLAFEYRQQFQKDVVIDIVCYRRRGHNEGDDPSMTQPLMYNLIEAKRSVRTLYMDNLIGRGDITQEDFDSANASSRPNWSKLLLMFRPHWLHRLAIVPRPRASAPRPATSLSSSPDRGQRRGGAGGGPLTQINQTDSPFTPSFSSSSPSASR